MTWVAPRDWVTDEVLTAPKLDEISGNLLALAHPHTLNTADVDVASTAAQTSLWTGGAGMTITGNSLGTNGMILAVLKGDMLYNNNTADTLRLRFKYGGTTVVDSGTFTPRSATSSTRYAWTMHVMLANRGATDAQILFVELVGGQAGTAGASSTGTGMIGRNPGTDTLFGQMYNTAAIDSTVNQTFDVTAEWSASAANNSFRKRWGQALLGQN